jgi:hypothetical protein
VLRLAAFISVVGILLAVVVAGDAVTRSADPAEAATTTSVRYGPFHLPAGTMSGPGQLHNTIVREGSCSWLTDIFAHCLNQPVPPPCTDCYITGMVADIVIAGTDTSLNHMNGGMLHHVVNLNFSRNDPTCPPNLFGNTINQLGFSEGGNERFFASGNERTPMDLPPGYGYRVNSGDEWGLIFHLMNMAPEARDVELEYTFTWVSSGVQPVKPIWFDIDQCGDSEVDLPAGYSDVHWDWNSRLQGTIVAIGGHVHDYGLSIALVNASTGENICTSVAGYAPESPYAPVGPGTGADAAHPVSTNVVTSDPLGLHMFHGHISDMTTCEPFSYVRGPRWWGIIPGHKLALHTQYYRPDANDHDMGIMIAYMHLQ